MPRKVRFQPQEAFNEREGYSISKYPTRDDYYHQPSVLEAQQENDQQRIGLMKKAYQQNVQPLHVNKQNVQPLQPLQPLQPKTWLTKQQRYSLMKHAQLQNVPLYPRDNPQIFDYGNSQGINWQPPSKRVSRADLRKKVKKVKRNAVQPRVQQVRVQQPRVQQARVQQPRVQQVRVQQPIVQQQPRIQQPRVRSVQSNSFEKLIIFDFDLTLTVVHFYNLLGSKATPENLARKMRLVDGESTSEDKTYFINVVFGGEERLTALIDTLTQCRKLGRLMICSKGITSQMIALCELIFGAQKFNELFEGQRVEGAIGAESLIYARPSQKILAANYHKDEIFLDLIRDMGVRQIIYFDDQAEDHDRLMERVDPETIEFGTLMGLRFAHTVVKGCDYYYYQVPSNPRGFDFISNGWKLPDIIESIFPETDA